MTVYSIQFRRDTRANWEAENPILAVGEKGFECLAINADGTLEYDIDQETGALLKPVKFGDGITPWNSLPYAALKEGPRGFDEDVIIPDASTTGKGRSRLATEGETAEEASESAAVTPAGLGSRAATVTLAGLARFATAEEAGVDGLLTSPSATKAAIDAHPIPDATADHKGAVMFVPGDDPGNPENATVTPATVKQMVAEAKLAPGISMWSAEASYSERILVTGSDRKTYQWLTASGPGAAAGPQDPTILYTLGAGDVIFGGWDDATLPTASSWVSQALNDAGQAIVVAANTTNTAISTDGGEHWDTGGMLPNAGPWNDVGIAPNGRVLAVGDGGGSGMNMSWTTSTLPSNSAWFSVSINNSNKVAAITGGTSSVAAYSTNGGQTWTASTLPSTSNWRMVSINDTGAAVTAAMNTNTAAYSTNGGQTWTAATLPSVANWSGISINNSNKTVTIAGMSTATTTAAYSTDGGKTWVASTLPTSAKWYAVSINNNNIAVAVASGTTAAAYSTDGGKTWAASTMPSASNWNNVSINNNNIVVAVATTTTAAAYSADGGKTWAAATLPVVTNWSGVSININNIALASSNTNNAAYSTDGGKTWAALLMPIAASWYSISINNSNAAVSIAYNTNSAVYGTFTAASPAGSAYSADNGQTWAISGLSFSPARGAAVNNSGQSCTVGPNTAKAAYSTNYGQAWTEAALPSVANWYDCALNANGQAVAVAHAASKAAYSTNGGQTWTAAVLPAAMGACSVAVNGSGHAVAVPSGSDQAAYSANGGKTWAASVLPISAAWRVSLNDDGVALATASNPAAAAFSRDAGQNWISISIPGGTLNALNGNGRYVSCAPSAAAAFYGDFAFDEAVVWNKYWAQFDTIPVGGNVESSSISTVPRDCLSYDGELYSRANYLALWGHINTFCAPVPDGEWFPGVYSVGNGSTTFRVPKMIQSGPVYNCLKAK